MRRNTLEAVSTNAICIACVPCSVALVLAACVTVGCQQRQSPLAAVIAAPEPRSRLEVGECFGATRHCRFTASVAHGGAPPVLIEIQWIEAGYAAYDVESRPAFARESVLAGVLLAPGGTAVFFGRRNADAVTLFDIDYLAGAKFSDLSSEELIRSLESANQAPDRFDRPRAVRLRGADGEEVRLLLSGRAMERLGAAQWREASLVPAAAPPGEGAQVWHGGFNGSDNDVMLFRVEAATVQPAADHAAARIGIATLRFRDHRFEGPAAPGSPWKDRRALGRDMDRLEEMGITWWDEAFDEQSAAALSEITGRAISADEYRGWIMETLGQDFDCSAAMVTCHLPEVRHIPLLEVVGARGRELVGMDWTIDTPDGGVAAMPLPQKLSRRQVVRLLHPPPGESSVSSIGITVLRGKTTRLEYPLRLQPVPPPP